MAEQPTHQSIDTDVLRERLEGWLARQWGRPGATIGSVEVPGASGFSAETVLVEMVDGDERLPLVVKTEPQGHHVFQEYDLVAQVRCMDAVRERGVPTPTVRFRCDDPAVLGRTFYVMDRVDGEVPRDNLPYTIEGFPKDLPTEDQRRLWMAGIDVLAAVHSVDVEAPGLGFLDRPDHGPAGFGQQLGWWMAYRRWVTARPLATIDRAHDRLVETLPADADGPPGLCWGDSRLGNIMFRGVEPVAVLDWEMAMLGPGVIDLAWYLAMDRFFSEAIGLPRLPGFPSDDDSVARYIASGGDEASLEHLDWSLLFAATRFAVVMVRITDGMRALGTAPVGWGDDDHPAVGLVDSLL